MIGKLAFRARPLAPGWLKIADLYLAIPFIISHPPPRISHHHFTWPPTSLFSQPSRLQYAEGRGDNNFTVLFFIRRLLSFTIKRTLPFVPGRLSTAIKGSTSTASSTRTG